MAIKVISIETYVNDYIHTPTIDVRSPDEYKHAHICNAINIPIFTNDERAIIGTAYKQQSREIAIKLGLDFFGVKMKTIVESVEDFLKKNKQATKEIIVHCARGGMRSATIAWLLDLYGFTVYQLEGGYKIYRQWVLEQCNKQYNFILLSGFTGSAKTEILYQLQKEKQNIIDLEGLAHHKGSSFGGIGQAPQPSQEMFENKLATQLFQAAKNKQDIYIEDESKRIGHVNIPNDLFDIIKNAPIIHLEIPFEERLKHITSYYGTLNKNELIDATKRIEKKLGGLLMKEAVQYLEDNKLENAFSILLEYYDRLYTKSMLNTSSKTHLQIKSDTIDLEKITLMILKNTTWNLPTN
jgi:tRNA 2-selenouridine synthase